MGHALLCGLESHERLTTVEQARSFERSPEELERIRQAIVTAADRGR